MENRNLTPLPVPPSPLNRGLGTAPILSSFILSHQLLPPLQPKALLVCSSATAYRPMAGLGAPEPVIKQGPFTERWPYACGAA